MFGLDDIDVQPDTTDMPDLESEEFAAQRRNQLKIINSTTNA